MVSSYAAKKVCSCTFIADRKIESILNEDLVRSPLNLAKTTIDYKSKRVASSVFGMHPKTAEFRHGLGCVLIHGVDDFNINLKSPTKARTDLKEVNFPFGHKIVDTQMDNVDYNLLNKNADACFDDDFKMLSKKTRALLILHKDTVLYEKYAEGYNENTEMLGWSMTKSILNAWVGMMIMDGKISLKDNNLFDEWNDERKEISLNNLMQMSSGLEWSEIYDEVSSATKMLFTAEDIVQSAKQSKLEYPPNTFWEYSSGSSNLIAGYLRDQFSDHDDYLKYPKERIFKPLGMDSMIMEIDEAGNFIGSSYSYATARDWAKFGTLYLRDGVWNNQRLLPDGWIDYTKAPAPASNGNYGAQFWLNVDGAIFKNAPYDTYSLNGYLGQRVYIVPSKDLVIVRMGLRSIDFGKMILDICTAIDYEKK